MDKPNFKNSFKTRKFKYGGYAAATTAVVIAILLIINLLAGQLNLKIDLTKNKLFSLSEQTTKVLQGVAQNINIYIFEEAGKEDPMLKAIMEKYSVLSDKVSIEYKDPLKYPQFAKQFTQNGVEAGQGSIVVSSGQKFKVISPYDLINYSYDQYGQSTADSLAIEQKVTSAIIYVTSGESPIIYTLKGHEELNLDSSVINKLRDLNYEVNDLNLALQASELTEGSTLIVASPQRDLTSDETNKIKDFLSKGGRGIFMMDLMQDNLPNFQSILNSYGVNVKKSYVVEGDPQYTAAQNPLFLVPDMQYHEIVSPLRSSGLPVILPQAQVIETLNVKKASTTVDALLTTSNKSWSKTNLNPSTLEKEAGDESGPFDIAVAITDTASDGGKDTKLVVVSNGLFLSPQFVNLYGNTDFLVNSINWLQDKKDLISVTPKSLQDGRLNLNSLQALVYSGLVVIVIPAAIVIWGISVLLRRKRQ